MAGYSFTPTSQASGYFGGGGWGGDIAGFAHSAYAGMNNGMQFANNLYDLQRRVNLEPYAQEAAIANLNAQKKQNELSGDDYGSKLWAENATRGISSGVTPDRLAGYPLSQVGTYNPAAGVIAGSQVGVVQPQVSQADIASQNAFADAVMRNKQTVFQPPVQPMATPVTPQMLAPPVPVVETAPVVQTSPVALDYTQDPQPARNAWSDGRWYG